jgi:hypothetical protein
MFGLDEQPIAAAISIPAAHCKMTRFIGSPNKDVAANYQYQALAAFTGPEAPK